MRHEVARTVVCYGYIVNKPAVPSAESIGTGVTGNGRVGSCRYNVPPPSRDGNDRKVVSVTASVKAVGGLDWMTRPTQVNCRKHRQRNEAKDADRLQPKGTQSGCPPTPFGHTDDTTAGVEAGANSFIAA